MIEETNTSESNLKASSDVPERDYVPLTGEEYNQDLKERIEERKSYKIIKFKDLPEETKLFKDWLYDVSRYGNVDDIILIYQYEPNRYGINLYTTEHRYHISIYLPNDSSIGGYAGCTVTTRKNRVGEDWNRGSDLPDGKYIPSTFKKIERGILRYELKNLELWRK